MSNALVLVLGLVAAVVVVLWVLLPFALFGVKPLLRELITETRQARLAIERQSKGSDGRA